MKDGRDYYVYVYIDPRNNEEFYYGKGRGNRKFAQLQQYARNTLQKNKRINIRLAERDLVGIQTKAMEEGMPYQTLIASILHKYLRGVLRERRNA